MLGDVCLIDKAKHNGAPSPYVGLENISNDTGVFLGDFEPTSVKSTTFRFDTRHLLYGRLRSYLNKALTPDFEGHCSSEIFPLRPKDELDRRYLFYWLTSNAIRKSIDSTSTGARMPRANMNEVMRFEIPLPPLEEQRRIVAVLDEAFEGLDRARAHVEANLQDARELFSEWSANAFQSIASHGSIQTVSVKDLALPEKGSIRTGPFGSQLLHSEFVEEGIAVLGIDNAVANEFRWDKRRFITTVKYEKLRRFTVRPGDVIVTIMGTCGRCAVIPGDIPTAINTKHLCCISLDPKKCLPEYLHRYFLLSRRARSYLSAEASGSVMDGLNMGIIKEMPVELPSIDEQTELVARVVDVEARMKDVVANYEAQKDDLGELRQSLLQRAFAGDLT